MTAATATYVELAPDPPTLIESLREIGYALPTEIADTIDNSIAAGATHVDILADTASDEPAIGILDKRCGMSKRELRDAMRRVGSHDGSIMPACAPLWAGFPEVVIRQWRPTTAGGCRRG